MKDWMKDIMFIAHVVIIVPIISVIYFGYAFTNLNIIFVLNHEERRFAWIVCRDRRCDRK